MCFKPNIMLIAEQDIQLIDRMWFDGGMLKVVMTCSGNTADQPGLLQYSCRLKTNIRPISAATISTPDRERDDDLEVMAGVLCGRPVLALSFENMEVW